MNETKEQFVDRIARKDGATREDVLRNSVVMECTCEDGGGPTHWARIPNAPEAIDDHLKHEESLAWLREYGA